MYEIFTQLIQWLLADWQYGVATMVFVIPHLVLMYYVNKGAKKYELEELKRREKNVNNELK